VSKEWSALTIVRSRECFIDVYIDNQCKIVIVYYARAIPIPYLKPLALIFRALGEAEPEHRENEFKRFVNEFGTHYAR
jgi:hypothetical protein